jgi:hypothetical protein
MCSDVCLLNKRNRQRYRRESKVISVLAATSPLCSQRSHFFQSAKPPTR